MRSSGHARGIAAAAATAWLCLGGSTLWAQEQTSATEPAAPAAAAAEQDPGLTAEELDTLLAPVALFPDALLTQVMMAATYPLDVVKADRFLTENDALTEKERADAIAATDWDPSVQALAAGFPDLIARMAAHLDWTEQTGDAVLAQTDDVLDSIQRLRAQAQDLGYLEENSAQIATEDEEGDIVISSKDPEVVYVPQYDPQVVYTTPAPSTPVYISDGGDDWDNILLTGGIIFGSAILLDEIFDDDDWDDYWRGPGSIDWDNGDFHPRPGVNIDGDVNIDRGDINIDRNRITNIDRESIDIDRDRIDVDRDRVGGLSQDRLDGSRNPGFDPDQAKRAEARSKIENRKAAGGSVAALPATRPGDGAKAGAAREAAASRPAAAKPVKINRPEAAAPARDIAKPARVSKPAKAQRPSASRPAAAAPKANSAFKKSGGSRAAAASNRGRASGGIKRGR